MFCFVVRTHLSIGDVIVESIGIGVSSSQILFFFNSTAFECDKICLKQARFHSSHSVFGDIVFYKCAV